MERGDLQNRAVRGALWTGIHTLVSLPLAFVVNIVVARVLDVEGYGRLTYLTTVIAIASVIAGMGVTTALIQFGSKAHAGGRPDEVRRLLSATQGFRLLVSGPLIALAVLAVVRVDWWLLIIALAFGVCAPAVFGGAQDTLTIENRTDRSAQVAMIANFVVQVAVVVAVVTIGTADAVWSARVIVSGLMLALPVLIISAQYRRAVLSPSPPWRLKRPFWRFAIPTGIAGIIGALVSDRTEVVILDWFSDEYAMGLFGLAFGLAGHVYAPAQAFVGPLVPAISALSEVDGNSVRQAFLRTTRAGSSIGGVLVVSLLPALALLVPLIYGERFAPASDLMVLLGISSAIVLIGSPHVAFLMARLGGRRMLWINVVGLAINLTLALALIPFFGAWGAAIACAGGMMALALQVTLGEARALGVPMEELLTCAGAILLAIAITVFLWLGASLLVVPAMALAPSVAVVGLVLFMFGLRLTGTGLTDGDVQAITRSLPKPIASAGRAGLTCLKGGRS